jgi:uronate dehydrogenase
MAESLAVQRSAFDSAAGGRQCWLNLSGRLDVSWSKAALSLAPVVACEERHVTAVLITGAAGMIATELRKRLSSRFSLKLTDIQPVSPLSEREQYVAADLADASALDAVMNGVQAVVHLGGVAVEDAWEKIMPANIAGAYNVFEAARRAGVKRIIVASSNHAVGYFPRNEVIDDRVLPRPDGRYGLSKAFAETLGRLYADKYGMEVFCIRIGAMTLEPEDVRRLAIWIHPDDLTSLVEIGLSAPGIHYEIVYGMSDNKRTWWDNSNALRLGYRPKHRSEDFADAVIAREPPRDLSDPVETYQGGVFVTAEAVVHRKSVTGR